MSDATKLYRRRRNRILRLFFTLVGGFLLQYVRARLTFRRSDFFADSRANRRRAIRIRDAALEQGGVLIKVGQFLSSRVDLLPPEYIEELALLQDEVPGVPYSQIRAAIERELGGTPDAIFACFDEVPLAAASLGQVHRATLPTGEQVAVKVRRPQIEDLVEADLEAIRYIVRWLQRHTTIRRKISLPDVLREFEDTLRLELDYMQEGHHAERLAVMFAGQSDVLIPRIYWSHSTGSVLTMQYMPGIKVNDLERMDREHVDRTAIAETLMRSYLYQILQVGFFHADPHPGNIFVRPGNLVIFVDFGMVGEITPVMRDNIRAAFIAIFRRDFDTALLAFERLGFIAPNADMGRMRRALIWAVDTFYQMSFGELRTLDPRDVLEELQDVLFSESFQIPSNFAFLGRALGTLTGLCTELDPTFQFVSVAEPFARQLMGRRGGALGTVEQLAEEARYLAVTAYSIPHLSRDALIRIQRGELDFRRHLEDVTRSVQRLERVLRRILYGVLVVGFLVAGAFVFNTRYQFLAVVAFGIAFILIVGVLPRPQPRR